MLAESFAAVALIYAVGGAYGYLARSLAGSPYPSPEEASAEIEQLAREYPEICALHEIGRSSEGRSLQALCFRRHPAPSARRPRLLITAHIHAVEYIGAYVVRALARRLAESDAGDRIVSQLLDRADVWIVPLLNPDGAARVWARAGWSLLGWSRFTANGVDPNRNFPFVRASGEGAWNSARDRPGSAYYRGRRPLSEPECLALARLCRRERFCAALNFHSFGGVVFMPAVAAEEDDRAADAFDVFREVFPAKQPYLRYRPIPERAAAIVGQLDSFLFNAFGTVSVTIEVSRPGLHLLRPWNTFNFFWWANPARPQRWVENDAEAAIHALAALVDRTGGKPCRARHPELAERIAETSACQTGAAG
jgi:hypothetical protein